MGYKYSFEKLNVWDDARRFVKEIYLLTESFPSKEMYGLSSQMQRAAVSVVSNIAEGVTRFSDKEKVRFVEIAYGSIMEVYCQLYVAMDLGYIGQDKFDELKVSVDEIANKLTSLAKSYRGRGDV